MTPRRELTIAVLGCAAGAALILLAASKGWQDVEVRRVDPLPPQRVSRSGAALHPLLPAVALVALAGAGAVLAVAGTARRILGVLLLGCGGAAAAIGVWATVTGAAPAWALLSCVGGLLVAAAGAATVVLGQRWPGMGTRYERPVASAPGLSAGTARDPELDNAHLWDALDRGEDRTREG